MSELPSSTRVDGVEEHEALEIAPISTRVEVREALEISPISTRVEVPEAPEISYSNGLENIVPMEGLTNQVGTESKRKTPWSREEEEMLTRSWLFISQDSSATKYPQLNVKIWKRICEYYNKNKKMGVKRKFTNLKAQWHFINAQVHDFNDIFLQLRNQYDNAFCDHQVKEASLEVYYSTRKKNFRYEHVWNLVKNEPKWRATISADSTKKKTKVIASAVYAAPPDIQMSNGAAQMSNGLDDNVVEVHPICQNGGKRKEKTKVTEQKAGGFDEINEKFQRENMRLTRKYMESIDTRNKVDENLLKVKEERLKMEEIQNLFKDTRHMTDEQLEMYQNYCKKIRAKHNL